MANTPSEFLFYASLGKWECQRCFVLVQVHGGEHNCPRGPIWTFPFGSTCSTCHLYKSHIIPMGDTGYYTCRWCHTELRLTNSHKLVHPSRCPSTSQLVQTSSLSVWPIIFNHPQQTQSALSEGHPNSKQRQK